MLQNKILMTVFQPNVARLRPAFDTHFAYNYSNYLDSTHILGLCFQIISITGNKLVASSFLNKKKRFHIFLIRCIYAKCCGSAPNPCRHMDKRYGPTILDYLFISIFSDISKKKTKVFFLLRISFYFLPTVIRKWMETEGNLN